MSIIPHHIQSQYYREVCDAQERGITVEELRAERKQKQAELDQMREDNATVLKGVERLASLGETGWYFTLEFANDKRSLYCYHDSDFYHEKIRYRFDGDTLPEVFAKLLEHFK